MLRSVVVMGVSGCGKSTVGRKLAQQMSAEFLEGDDVHSQQNVARMAAGIALTDEDRQGWLEALAVRLTLAKVQGRSLVISCSALKRSYRNILREGEQNLLLVYLKGDYDLLADRMARRASHYMPSSLLDSQFAALEPPGADENALTLDVEQSPELIVGAVVEQLRH